MADPKKRVVIAGKYELKKPLGKGGHGTVYRATHLDLGEDVAIKVLNPEFARDEEARKRFLREAKLATSFVHKYAVQLRDFGRDPGLDCLYLTMDLIEGPTLHDVMTTEGALDEARAVRLFAQVCEALDEAHRAGIVHRDLKPANLILTTGRDGAEEVRILDFGVAKAVTQAAQDALGMTGLTMSGMRVGTLLYMSPEQAQGLEIDGRSDLYTIGALLYESLSGKKPIGPDRKAENPMQSFLFRISAAQPRALREVAPHVSPGLDAIVMRLLQKSPAKRFATAGEARQALLALPPSEAVPPTRAHRRPAKLDKDPTRSAPLTKVGPAAPGSSEAPTVREPARRAVPPTPMPTGSSSDLASSSRASSKDRAKPPRTPPATAKRVSLSTPKVGTARAAAAKTPALLVGRRSSAKVPGLPEGLVPGKRPGEFVNVVDGSVLLWVPAGAFRMGTSKSRPQEGPPHPVTLTRGYYIGKVPITWKRYRRFCRKTGRAAPSTVDFKSVMEITDRHPAVNVTWEDAVDYCRWARLRLPTEAEWELAARGADGRAYPWGNEVPSVERANWEGHPLYGGKSTSPTGAFPRGAAPCGALDMAGNVWEWTQDWFGAYRADAQTDPAGPKGGEARVLRGGCWQSDDTFLLTTARLALAPTERRNWVGFRVCRSG